MVGTMTPAAAAKRRHDQSGLIANAAGGMLVHFDTGNPGQIERFARLHHRFGEPADFPVCHVGKKTAMRKADIW